MAANIPWYGRARRQWRRLCHAKKIRAGPGTTRADVAALEKVQQGVNEGFVAIRFSCGDVEKSLGSYSQAVSDVTEETRQLDEITKNAFGHGALVGARDYFAGLKDHAGQAAEFVKNAFTSLERALGDFLQAASCRLKNFVDTVKRVSAASVCDYANSL